MAKYGSVLFLVILAIVIMLACGSSPQRTLQSVSLSPAIADAQGGPVQFTATGYFNQQPSPVSLSTSNWGACYQNQPTADVSVSANGVAQCATGATGTYTVWTWTERTGGSCSAPTGVLVPVNPCGGSGECNVTGTAQLKCP